MPRCLDCYDFGWFIAAPDGDDTRDWVERCDNCQKLASDDDAAIAAARATGRLLGFAQADCLFNERYRPYLLSKEATEGALILAAIEDHPAGKGQS